MCELLCCSLYFLFFVCLFCCLILNVYVPCVTIIRSWSLNRNAMNHDHDIKHSDLKKTHTSWHTHMPFILAIFSTQGSIISLTHCWLFVDAGWMSGQPIVIIPRLSHIAGVLKHPPSLCGPSICRWRVKIIPTFHLNGLIHAPNFST